MEHDTDFDYAGNHFNGNPYSNYTILTPSIFNASDFDFSDMLNFTPPIGNLEMTMLNMPGDSRLAASNFLGDYTSASEFPFPAIPANTYTLPLAVASTMAPAGQKRAQPATISASADEEPKPKRRRGARKKIRTEEEIAIKRENRLQRNRDAAQKCRKKKQLTEAEKKEQLVKERYDNHIVWNQVAAVQDELESLRNLTLDIKSHCQSSDYKAVAKISLESIIETAAKLQDQVDTCNQRRTEISPGLIMQKSHGG
ncbi:hypothetical protein BKA65DRAFT_570963 [Rhexocercosporidium sp. MPI-PUGE-AT-0058]|nr:hypothetical protein BKA65DRAFT_570963 [Rhexocercosporidium sp. MPI-PUGE-AT-0058]